MFSKREGWLHFAVVTLISLAVVGCGMKWFGDAKKSPSAFVIANNEAGCLNEIGTKTQDFLDAKLSQDDVRGYFSCLRGALTRFNNGTSGGEVEGRYSPTEIRQFLLTHFVQDRPLTSELMVQIIKLKQGLVGGSDQFVTQSELARLIELLVRLEKNALKLQPYMSIYNPRVGVMSRDINSLPVSDAVRTLGEVAQDIGQAFAESKQSYDLQNLQVLMIELRKFLKWDVEYPKSTAALRWSELFKSMASVSVGRGTVVPAERWETYLKAGAGWYSTWVEFFYRYKHGDHSIFSPDGFDNLDATVQRVLNLLDVSVQQQNNKVVTFTQLDAVVDALFALEFLPTGVLPVALKQVLRSTVVKIFGDVTKPVAERDTQGVTPPHVKNLRNEVTRWREVQLYLNTALPGEYTIETLGQRPGFVSPHEFFSRFKPSIFSSFNQSDLEQDFKRISQQRLRPLYVHGVPKVVLSYERDQQKYQLRRGIFDLSMKNIYYNGIRLLIRGYAHDSNRFKTLAGLTGEEMQEFIDDFKEFFRDVKIMDPEAHRPGYRMLMEGKTFTYAARGMSSGPYLEVEEAMELFAYMFSSSFATHAVYEYMQKYCPTGELDIFGLPKIKRACFEQMMHDKYPHEIENLLGLYDFMAAQSPKERSQFYRIAIEAALKPTKSPEWIEFAQIAIMNMIYTYLESVITRFDLNADGYISHAEIQKGYPIFKGMIEYVASLRGIDASKMRKVDLSRIFGFEIEDLKSVDFDDMFLNPLFTFIVLRQKVPQNAVDAVEMYMNNMIFWLSGEKVPVVVGPVVIWVQVPEFKVSRQEMIRVFWAMGKAQNAAHKPARSSIK